MYFIQKSINSQDLFEKERERERRMGVRELKRVLPSTG